MLTSKRIRGAKVLKHSGRKAGEIKEVLFAPKTKQVVGYIVERGDILLMFKRKDKFLARDKAVFSDSKDEFLAAAGKEVWEEAALKRLGYSYDEVIIWRGMPAVTEDGREAGHVSDLIFDEKDGRLLGVRLSEGALATTLLGRKDIQDDLIVSCSARGVIVKNAALATEASGGLVNTAATATAIAGDRITRGTKAAVRTAAKGAGMIKKHTSGMLSAFKEEYQKGLESKE